MIPLHDTSTTGATDMASGVAAHFRMRGRYYRLANERLHAARASDG